MFRAKLKGENLVYGPQAEMEEENKGRDGPVGFMDRAAVDTGILCIRGTQRDSCRPQERGMESHNHSCQEQCGEDLGERGTRCPLEK